MFLFLSKLLPLFIYPLGLSCLLLIVALITLGKRPKWAAFPIILALIILLVSSSGWVSKSLIRSLEWQNLPASQLPNADAIVVLGGGIKPQIPPRPWVEVSEAGDRILYGSLLYKQGKAPLLILSGGRVEWKGGGPPEAEDMAKIAMEMGVPNTAILQDTTSLNTYQNAVNVRQILASKNIRRILLVTSALHIPRSILIFQRQNIEVIPAPTDFLVSEQDFEELNTLQGMLLNLLPDAANLQRTNQALKEYIGLIIYRLLGWL